MGWLCCPGIVWEPIRENKLTSNPSINAWPLLSQFAEPLWTDPSLKQWNSVHTLISTKKYVKKCMWGMNHQTFPPNPRKWEKSHHFWKFLLLCMPFCIIHHGILSLRYVDVQCFMLCYVSYCSQMNFLLESMKLYCGMVTNSPAVNFSRPENTVWEDPRLSDSLWLSQTIKVLPAINVHFSTLQGPVTSMLNICSHFLSGFLLQTL